MNPFVLRVAVLVLLPVPPALPAAQAQADSGAFVVRLGVDTIGMERYHRSGDRIEITVLGRSPRTVVRRAVLWLAPDGSVSRVATGAEGQPLEERANPQPGTIPVLGGSWIPWQLVLQRARAAATDTTTVTVLAGGSPRPTPVRRTGPDRFALANQFDQAMAARVDEQGRLLQAELAGGGTSVERVAGLDLARWTREFSERDARGSGLGPLSPVDSASAVVQGARISVGYGRPSLRGRPLDVLAPPGEVWRMGANDATVLTTDRAVRFEGLRLAPGSYSLFAVPGREGWTLIVNRQTGISGLERNPAQDLGRVPMRTRRDAAHTERFTIEVRPEAGRGALTVRWGPVEAVARFEVES